MPVNIESFDQLIDTLAQLDPNKNGLELFETLWHSEMKKQGYCGGIITMQWDEDDTLPHQTCDMLRQFAQEHPDLSYAEQGLFAEFYEIAREGALNLYNVEPYFDHVETEVLIALNERINDNYGLNIPDQNLSNVLEGIRQLENDRLYNDLYTEPLAYHDMNVMELLKQTPGLEDVLEQINNYEQYTEYATDEEEYEYEFA